jgi:hypothetical protein
MAAAVLPLVAPSIQYGQSCRVYAALREQIVSSGRNLFPHNPTYRHVGCFSQCWLIVVFRDRRSGVRRVCFCEASVVLIFNRATKRTDAQPSADGQLFRCYASYVW